MYFTTIKKVKKGKMSCLIAKSPDFRMEGGGKGRAKSNQLLFG